MYEKLFRDFLSASTDAFSLTTVIMLGNDFLPPGANVPFRWRRSEKEGCTCAADPHSTLCAGAGLPRKIRPAPLRPVTCSIRKRCPAPLKSVICAKDGGHAPWKRVSCAMNDVHCVRSFEVHPVLNSSSLTVFGRELSSDGLGLLGQAGREITPAPPVSFSEMYHLRLASPHRQRPSGEEGLCIEPPAPGRAVAAAPAIRAAAVPSLPALSASATVRFSSCFPALLRWRLSVQAVVSRPCSFGRCLCRQLFPDHDLAAYVRAGSYFPAK